MAQLQRICVYPEGDEQRLKKNKKNSDVTRYVNMLRSNKGHKNFATVGSLEIVAPEKNGS